MADQNILIKFSADTQELNSAIKTTEAQLDSLSSEAGTAASATQKLQGGMDALKNSTSKFTKENMYLRDGMEELLYATTGLTREQARAAAGLTRLGSVLKGTSQAFRLLAGSIAVLGIATLIPLLIFAVKNFTKLTDAIGITNKAVRELDASLKALEEKQDKRNKILAIQEKLLKNIGRTEKELLEVRKEAIAQSQVENTAEIARLQRERRRLEEQLKSRGALGAYLITQFGAVDPIIENIGKLNKAIDDLQFANLELQTQIIDTDTEIVKQAESTKKLGEETEKTTRQLYNFERAVRNIEGLKGGVKINRLIEGGISPRTSQREDDSSSRIDKRIEKEKEYIGYLVESLTFVNDLTAMIANARSAKIQGEIDDLNKLKDAELENAELTARQKERIEERYAKKVGELKTKQAKAERRAAISQALVNGALAITNILAGARPITWPLLLAIAAATTAAQVATIAATPLPKYRKGGAVDGKRHESGGVHIEAEGGEWIHNREAVAYYGKDFMKDINEMRIPKSVLMPDLPAAVIAGAVSHGIDHERLGKTIGRELAKQPKVSIALDERGFTKHISDGSNRTMYANRKFNAK